MALMDELEGVLGKDVIAKLPPEMRAKVEFGDELTQYYDGASAQEPVRKAARAPEPAAAAPVVPAAAAAAPLAAGLADIEKLFDTRLTTLETDLTTKITAGLKTEADGMFSRAVATSLQLADDLNDVRELHRTTFGVKLDRAEFDKFVKENGGMAKFGTIDSAYKAWQGPNLEQKRIDEGIREGLKVRNSGASLPGVSPSGSKGPVSILSARRRDGSAPAADAPKSNIEKAADALAGRLAVNE